MIAADVQAAFQRLQAALDLSVVCGQITLNVNNGELQSVERIREFDRVPSEMSLDTRERRRVGLTR